MLHRLFRPIYLIVLLLGTIMGPSVSAYAQAVDVFTVRSVPVDARAADELTAKSVGIAAGQKSAFNGLLRRLTLQADHDRLPSVDDQSRQPNWCAITPSRARNLAAAAISRH